MNRDHPRITSIVPGLLLAAASTPPASGQSWLLQFGSTGGDLARGACSDGAGGIFISGFTTGDLGGPSAGGDDAFLARVDRSGAKLWTRQFGTPSAEYANAVAPDGSGGAYVVGMTGGALGGPVIGGFDCFLARYDASGSRQWIRQFGVAGGSEAAAVALSSGAVFVGGLVSGSLGGPHQGGTDCFLARYDASGNQLWVRQFGTPELDNIQTIVGDGAGGVFVAGTTTGNLAAPAANTNGDAFVARYDSTGVQFWIRQYGSVDTDMILAAAPDGNGGVFVAGPTSADLGGPNAGGTDISYAHFDAAGSRLWLRQFGTPQDDAVFVARPDSLGGFYLAGWTAGVLGASSSGGNDAYVTHCDSAGNRTWTIQYGTPGYDAIDAAAPDGSGGLLVAGITSGNLAGPNAGPFDVHVGAFTCYANCDGSTSAPILAAADYVCFTGRFLAGDTYANCDASTAPPVLNVADFICYINRFAAGCP